MADSNQTLIISPKQIGAVRAPKLIEEPVKGAVCKILQVRFEHLHMTASVFKVILRVIVEPTADILPYYYAVQWLRYRKERS